MAMGDALMADLQAAMRAGNAPRRDILRMLRSELHNEEVARLQPLDEEAEIQVLQREAKKRQEALEMFRQAGRQDLVDKTEADLAVIAEYLPEPMGPEEIEALVRQAISASGADDIRQMGQVMKIVMPLVKGKADGKIVNETVRRLLSPPS